MKRILLINWRDIRNPEAGGAETYYHEIFRRLAANYSVTVISHAVRDLPAREDIDGIRVLRFGSRTLFNFSAMRYVLGHQGDYDLVVEDINKVPFFTPWYCRTRRLHMVMHFFGTSIFHEIAVPMAAYIYGMERLVSLAYRGERFVAISASTRSEILDRCGSRSHVDVVEPGIDTAFYRPTQPKDPAPVLVYFGRLKKYKNVQFVIRCLPQIRAAVPGTRLIVAGSGDYRPELEAVTRRLGLDEAVTFAGFVPEEEKLDILSRATLKVNPSYKEGWGITNIEAALCGTASLSANVPGLRDSVRDGVTGLLFRPDDPRDFVDKATRLLTDTNKRGEMERNAAAYGKTFAWDAMAGKMRTVIAGVLEE